MFYCCYDLSLFPLFERNTSEISVASRLLCVYLKHNFADSGHCISQQVCLWCYAMSDFISWWFMISIILNCTEINSNYLTCFEIFHQKVDRTHLVKGFLQFHPYALLTLHHNTEMQS